MDKKIINNLKKKIYLVFKSFNAYLVHSCSEYKNFSGRDIDAFYEKNYFFDVTYKKDLIARIKNNNYRICEDSVTEEDPKCSDSCAPVSCISTSDHLYYLNVTMGSSGC